MTREEIVKNISLAVKAIAPWSTTILFGSQARGEATAESDIDLLILVPDGFKKDYNKIRSNISDKLYEIELESGVLISPLILLQGMWNDKNTPFTYNVRKDGILL